VAEGESALRKRSNKTTEKKRQAFMTSLLYTIKEEWQDHENNAQIQKKN
jgi:hypothetical protein